MWGPPSRGPRSAVLARELGTTSLHFVYPNMRRGFVSALYRYSAQARETWQILSRERPQIIFVQSPPSLAVLCVYAYARRYGAIYVIDAHSAAFQYWFWTRPRWLFRVLAKHAATTLVTNSFFEKIVRNAGGNAMILRDIPTTFEQSADVPLIGAFNLVVVNTFAPDEPLTEILTAASVLPDIQFYVTGKCKNAPPHLLSAAPANVQFTDYLPDARYYGLVARADAVMCLTLRDNTMQRGACEALSLARPIITSDWTLLRDYFRLGTVHVANTAGAIEHGVREMRTHHARYASEIRVLQQAQQREWQEKRERLRMRLNDLMARRERNLAASLEVPK